MISAPNPLHQHQINPTGKLPLAAKLYLICFMMPFGFNIGPLYMNPLRAFIMLSIIPMFAKLLAGRYGRVTAIDILFLLFTLWTSIALTQTSPEMVITNTGAFSIEFLGGYIIGRATIREQSSFLTLCLWLGVLVAISVPFALIETLTNNPILITTLGKIPGILGLSNVNYEPRLGLFRAQVFLAHPIHYGLFCSTVTSLTFLCLKGHVSDRVRYALTGCTAIGVLLSLSSGALLPMFLQIGIIAWAWALRTVKSKWWILLAIFGMFWISVDIASNRSPLMVILHYLTFSAHNAFWRIMIFEWGMINVWNSPLFGIGFNDWERPEYMHTSSVDNFWLLNTMRYGIPAFIFLSLGYGLGLSRIIFKKLKKNSPLSPARLSWSITFISLTLTLCTVHVWTAIMSYIFFLFGAGMWMMRDSDKLNSIDLENSSPVMVRRNIRYTRFPASQKSQLKEDLYDTSEK